jgi:hypothetical protein
VMANIQIELKSQNEDNLLDSSDSGTQHANSMNFC